MPSLVLYQQYNSLPNKNCISVPTSANIGIPVSKPPQLYMKTQVGSTESSPDYRHTLRVPDSFFTEATLLMWFEIMCQHEAGSDQECAYNHKLGSLEYHLLSEPYSISRISIMSSEKHPTCQVLLKQQREWNEAQVHRILLFIYDTYPTAVGNETKLLKLISCKRCFTKQRSILVYCSFLNSASL